MEEIIKKIDRMKELSNYDSDKFINSLNCHLDALLFYYDTVCDGERMDLTLRHRDYKVGEVVYVQLGRGYPKELMDGHWCYIYQLVGDSKAVIIPTTSVRGLANEDYEMDIQVGQANYVRGSRLKFSEVRIIDLQRIYDRKGKYECLTDANVIMRKMLNFMI